MILSERVIDTVFRGTSISDDMTKLYLPRDGYFPTSLLRDGYGRAGKRRSTPLYNCWVNMQQRCLVGSEQQRKIKSYKACSSDFKDYQDFAEFCYSLPFFTNTDSKGVVYEIDKDIKGYLLNKPNLYSKETLCAIPKEINCFLTCIQLHNGAAQRSTKGVIQNSGGNFLLRLQDVCGDGKRKYLSRHETYEDAYSELLRVKSKQAKHLASKYEGNVESIVIDFLNNFNLEDWEKWTYHKWSCKEGVT